MRKQKHVHEIYTSKYDETKNNKFQIKKKLYQHLFFQIT